MRTLVAGSRDFGNYNLLERTLLNLENKPTVILSGTARGADQIGEWFALKHKILLEKYPANWDTYGKSAGYRRNELMVWKAEQVVVFWDGESKGTKHTIELTKGRGLYLLIVKYKETSIEPKLS